MFILSRRRGESVVAGGTVEFLPLLKLTVTTIEYNNVWLRLEADKPVVVWCHKARICSRDRGATHFSIVVPRWAIQQSVILVGADVSPHQLSVRVTRCLARCVKLGFEIDRSVPVHRHEIWERIHGCIDSGFLSTDPHGTDGAGDPQADCLSGAF